MNTILFDLDGTLIPMDQDEFVNAYFGELVKKVAYLGYKKEELIPAVWKGTKAMSGNDGSCTNFDAFWNYFASVYGEGSRTHISVFDDFYSNEFDRAKKIVAFPCSRKAIIDDLKTKGYTLVLATNPLFPACAVETRLKWLDLKMDDFALVTHYENSCYCKPNPEYFRSILSLIGKTVSDCIMIGNNTFDDMKVSEIGMETYLVTDYLENAIEADIGTYKNGSFKQLEEYLRNLPPVK